MTTDTKNALLSAVLAEPGEPAHKLAMADLLLEEGADALAHAYRWMAARRKHPHHRTHYRLWSPEGETLRRVPADYSWAWWPPTVPDRVKSRERVYDVNKLPRLAFLATGRNRDRHLFGSFEEAVLALALGLDRMRVEFEVPR